MMSSILRKTSAMKPIAMVAHGKMFPAALSAQNQFGSLHQTSSYSTGAETEDDRLFPVYVHHVSRVVLQHLQNSRAGWLSEQGLDRGLRINSNGTFMLNFPAKKGYDAGKIWTSYDASTRKHWLSVYRQKFNGKFLLKQSNSPSAKIGMSNNDYQSVEDHICSVVDEMVRRVPPRISATTAKN